jgi:hypothetical protein
MIDGLHAIFYTKHAEEVRGFLPDVLELPSVDAGDGWLIFAAPPTELAVHPTDGASEHELFLMCTDINAVVARLAERGIETTMPVTDRGWGLVTQLRLPGGDTLGLYEPRHASPLQRGKA